jgi:hypothetical protein
VLSRFFDKRADALKAKQLPKAQAELAEHLEPGEEVQVIATAYLNRASARNPCSIVVTDRNLYVFRVTYRGGPEAPLEKRPIGPNALALLGEPHRNIGGIATIPVRVGATELHAMTDGVNGRYTREAFRRAGGAD